MLQMILLDVYLVVGVAAAKSLSAIEDAKICVSRKVSQTKIQLAALTNRGETEHIQLVFPGTKLTQPSQAPTRCLYSVKGFAGVPKYRRRRSSSMIPPFESTVVVTAIQKYIKW